MYFFYEIIDSYGDFFDSYNVVIKFHNHRGMWASEVNYYNIFFRVIEFWYWVFWRNNFYYFFLQDISEWFYKVILIFRDKYIEYWDFYFFWAFSYEFSILYFIKEDGVDIADNQFELFFWVGVCCFYIMKGFSQRDFFYFSYYFI